MSIPNTNIQLLEESFEIIQLSADEFAIMFYEHLFNDFPQARTLFKTTNMLEQRKKLLKSLGIIVKSLDDQPTLQGILSSLGRQHHAYGVNAEHYPMVGQTLIKTMKIFCGSKWSNEMEEAWIQAYDTIASSMLVA